MDMWLFELMVGIAGLVSAAFGFIVLAGFVGALISSIFYLLTGQPLF